MNRRRNRLRRPHQYPRRRVYFRRETRWLSRPPAIFSARCMSAQLALASLSLISPTSAAA